MTDTAEKLITFKELVAATPFGATTVRKALRSMGHHNPPRDGVSWTPRPAQRWAGGALACRRWVCAPWRTNGANIPQMDEAVVPRSLFQKILGLIDDLRPRPAPA